MLSLKQCLQDIVNRQNDVVDYVVEIGRVNYSGATDTTAYNYWTYRKWKSGLAECWTTYYAERTIGVAWGSWRRSAIGDDLAFPFTFAQIPTVTRWAVPAPVSGHNADGVLVLQYSQPSVTSTGTCFYSKNTTATCTAFLWCSVHANGKWK